MKPLRICRRCGAALKIGEQLYCKLCATILAFGVKEDAK